MTSAQERFMKAAPTIGHLLGMDDEPKQAWEPQARGALVELLNALAANPDGWLRDGSSTAIVYARNLRELATRLAEAQQ